MKPTRFAARALFAACALSGSAMAVEFEFSGFASIVAGRTRGPCTESGLATDYSDSCTRFVADWAHAGVYTDKASLKPETKAGLQATARFAEGFSATAQVVGRIVEHPAADLEWAYVTWSPSPSWTFQAGRKRVPLFFYSDFQDVGYAYPWVRVPPDVYGWDVVNFNGASATYSANVGSWALRSSAFAGAETSRKNQYAKLLYDEGKDVKWPKIAGADLELSREWLTARVVYMRSGYEQIDRATGEPDVQESGDTHGTHTAYGGSINIDYGNWIGRSEYSVFDRSRYTYKATSWFVSAGYRIGAFTPMVTASSYTESTRFPELYDVSKWKTRSASLRYDFGKSQAVKIQVDRLRDLKAPIPGDATLVSVSYDVVF